MIGHLDWFYEVYFVLSPVIVGLAAYLWMAVYSSYHMWGHGSPA
jgi:hypothetical protein